MNLKSIVDDVLSVAHELGADALVAQSRRALSSGVQPARVRWDRVEDECGRAVRERARTPRDEREPLGKQVTS